MTQLNNCITGYQFFAVGHELLNCNHRQPILKSLNTDHFKVVWLVTWPMNESEARFDFVLIETSLLFLCKFQVISIQNNIRNIRKGRRYMYVS